MDKRDEEIFRGYLPKISKDNELAAWQHIRLIAKEALRLYPTTLKKDKKKLKKHKKDIKILTQNERNCILYRISEKVALEFLIDCADKVEELV